MGSKKFKVFEINYEILNNFDSVAHYHSMTHDSRTLNCPSVSLIYSNRFPKSMIACAKNLKVNVFGKSTLPMSKVVFQVVFFFPDKISQVVFFNFQTVKNV